MPLSANKDYILKRGDVIISNFPLNHSFTRNGLSLEIEYHDNEGNNSLELPLLYYKGYKASTSEKVLNVYQTDNGLVGVDIDTNKDIIYVSYAGTKIQKLSKAISVVAVFIFGIYLYLKKRGVADEK